jgi:hypothetical protein
MEQNQFTALPLEEKLSYLFNEIEELKRKFIEIAYKQLETNEMVYEQIKDILKPQSNE